MKTMIKKTLSIRLGLEEYTIALMDKIGWKETERKATGGQIGEERLQITFEGYDTDYSENNYVKVKTDTDGYFLFYSLRQVDGYFTNDVQIFKDMQDKNKPNFEICSFGDVQ